MTFDYPDPGTDPAYCDGISLTPDEAREICPDCNGSGELPDPELPNTWIDCPECQGFGYYKLPDPTDPRRI